MMRIKGALREPCEPGEMTCVCQSPVLCHDNLGAKTVPMHPGAQEPSETSRSGVSVMTGIVRTGPGDAHSSRCSVTEPRRTFVMWTPPSRWPVSHAEVFASCSSLTPRAVFPLLGAQQQGVVRVQAPRWDPLRTGRHRRLQGSV